MTIDRKKIEVKGTKIANELGYPVMILGAGRSFIGGVKCVAPLERRISSKSIRMVHYYIKHSLIGFESDIYSIRKVKENLIPEGKFDFSS